jgi:hypothetical protein
MLGVGTGLGGELRQLRFPLKCEMDFHDLKLRENRARGKHSPAARSSRLKIDYEI